MLRKNTLGIYRLDHDNGQHDDQAITLALALGTCRRSERVDQSYRDGAPRPAVNSFRPMTEDQD